jgi:hypothetical protein
VKKIIILLTVSIVILLAAWPAGARNLLPISVALRSKDALETPDGSVKFFFAKQERPEIATKLGTGSTHQRSSTRPSEDAKSCNVAFLKALVALQKNAKQVGANATPAYPRT